MVRQLFSRALLAIAVASILSACATTPIEESPVSGNPAVIALADTARNDIAAYRYADAAASIERALRIEPRNARLWHELARIRLGQEDYPQAENMAKRSNSYAMNDTALRRANWKLIAECRRELGDLVGAEAAVQKSKY
jgi:tetratricopeptide (TPR) repeat protein